MPKTVIGRGKRSGSRLSLRTVHLSAYGDVSVSACTLYPACWLETTTLLSQPCRPRGGLSDLRDLPPGPLRGGETSMSVACQTPDKPNQRRAEERQKKASSGPTQRWMPCGVRGDMGRGLGFPGHTCQWFAGQANGRRGQRRAGAQLASHCLVVHRRASRGFER